MRYEKEKVTKLLIDQLQHLDIIKNTSFKEVMQKMWMTGYYGSGFRLTGFGQKLFVQANIAHYDYPIDPNEVPHKNKFLLDLNNKIICPYYLGIIKNTLYFRIYDSKIAMMIGLYGNIVDYIESLRKTR